MQPRVSAVLLAAGLSRRMGRPKQLLLLNGKPAIRCCTEALLAAGVSDIVAVLGTGSEGAARALAGFPVSFAYNTDPESDMAGSVRAGLRRVSDSSTGVLVCLADHPLVLPETMIAVIDAHRIDPRMIVVPRFEGRRGHPTLFPKPALRELSSGATLRDVIAHHCDLVRLVEVADEGVVLDMDTPDDYERLRSKFEQVF